MLHCYSFAELKLRTVGEIGLKPTLDTNPKKTQKQHKTKIKTNEKPTNNETTIKTQKQNPHTITSNTTTTITHSGITLHHYRTRLHFESSTAI